MNTRLRIRPVGVESKNAMGARNKELIMAAKKEREDATPNMARNADRKKTKDPVLRAMVE